ncbi:uncharacterized protein [Panulirus ornatus]
MASRDKRVDHVLAEVRKLNKKVHRKKKVLNEFLVAVKEKMNECKCELLRGAFFQHSGSGFEGTAVSDEACFDILLVLPEPFRGHNFEVTERHGPGSYKLQWTDNEDVEKPDFINKNGYLQARKLRDSAYDGLSEVLSDMRDHNGWSVHYNPPLDSLSAKLIDKDGDTLKIDIVAQIGEPNCYRVPGMIKRGQLPRSLQDYIHRIAFPVFYNLAPSCQHQTKTDAHLLVSTSFSLLEKHCMKETERLRDIVILVKLVSQSRNWKKDFFLQAIHIKRVAIKHYDELNAECTWAGFQKLLRYLSSELKIGVIKGFFIDDEDIFCKNENTCKLLTAQIRGAKSLISPSNLWNVLPGEE